MKKIIISLAIVFIIVGSFFFLKEFSGQLTPLKPNIILVSLDTMRKDRLSCYGYPNHKTLNIDTLAGESCLFTNAITQYPATRQSHMTFMTSLYPAVHGLTQKRGDWEDNRMNPVLQPLAELLKNNGYYTIGITEGCFVAGSLGFSRGFDEYYDQRLNVAKIFQQATDWLKRNSQRRFFMFLHTYETHVPYDPPEEFLPLEPSEYSWEHKMVGSWEYDDRKKKNELQLDPANSDFLKKLNQLYDGEVLFVDREWGTFIESLKSLNLYNNLLLIVVSDHGESLGEKGEFGHGRPWQNNMEAVLIIKFPENVNIEQPQVIGYPVGLIDIPPTITDLLGINSQAQPFQGRNLFASTRVKNSEPTPVYSDFGGGAMTQDGRWKYLRTNSGKESLFDLELDPEEDLNLLPDDLTTEARAAYERLKNYLLQTQAKNIILRKDFGPRGKVKLPEKKILKSLGYL